MDIYWLGLTLSLAMPLLLLANSFFLLKRAIRPKEAHYIALAASAMVFCLSAIWLGNSVTHLIAAYKGAVPSKVYDWAVLNATSGPSLAVALLFLSGGFWAWLALRQRKPANCA